MRWTPIRLAARLHAVYRTTRALDSSPRAAASVSEHALITNAAFEAVLMLFNLPNTPLPVHRNPDINNPQLR
ncbi:hypothetical protein EYZ11_003460 [Aspergillus tanneri]|nr:hypothetical protein EYZ11_003460 [Aspergillus tanneri]